MKFYLLLIAAIFSTNTTCAQIEFEQKSSVTQSTYTDSILIENPILSNKIIEDSKQLLERVNQNSTSINSETASNLLKDYKVKYIIYSNTFTHYGKTTYSYIVEKYENKNPIVLINKIFPIGLIQLTHEKDYIKIDRIFRDIGNTYEGFSQECWILEKIL